MWLTCGAVPVLFVTCSNVTQSLDVGKGFDVIGLFIISRDCVGLDGRKMPTGRKGVRR
jgi:hypothetical protein